MAATSVGTTKGSIKARKSSPRPGNSKRANTHATGTPNTSTSAQVSAACNPDHSKRQRR